MNKYLEEVLNNKHAFTLQSSAFKSKLIILDDADFNLLCDHIKFSTFVDYDTIIIGNLIFKRDELVVKSYDKSAVGLFMAQQGLLYQGDYNSYENWFDAHYETWFEIAEENKFYLKDEEDFGIYTKSEVIDFIAQQGNVYNGLDEHADKWFEIYYTIWFEKITEDKYILRNEK